MDQLELLKKSWSKDADNYQHLTSSEISPMLWKKSSSIVKTLFYISIGELVFWTLLNFLPIFMSQEYNDKINSNTFFDNTSIDKKYKFYSITKRKIINLVDNQKLMHNHFFLIKIST